MSRWWFRGIGMALLAAGLWVAYAKQATYDPSRYSGGDGLITETVIVVEIASDLRGIALEYVWPCEHYPGGGVREVTSCSFVPSPRP
jgi:hypothetical protein